VPEEATGAPADVAPRRMAQQVACDDAAAETEQQDVAAMHRSRLAQPHRARHGSAIRRERLVARLVPPAMSSVRSPAVEPALEAASHARLLYTLPSLGETIRIFLPATEGSTVKGGGESANRRPCLLSAPTCDRDRGHPRRCEATARGSAPTLSPQEQEAAAGGTRLCTRAY